MAEDYYQTLSSKFVSKDVGRFLLICAHMSLGAGEMSQGVKSVGDEPMHFMHGVLGSRENGGKTTREPGAEWEKVWGAGSRGTYLGSREPGEKSREQGEEEII